MNSKRSGQIHQLVQFFGRTVRCRIIGELLESGSKSLTDFKFDKVLYQVSDREKKYDVKNSPTTIHRHLKDMETDKFVVRERKGKKDHWSLNLNHPLIRGLLKSFEAPYIPKEQYDSVLLNFHEKVGVDEEFTTKDLRNFMNDQDLFPSSARLSQLIRQCVENKEIGNPLVKQAVSTRKISRGRFMFEKMPEK